MIILLIYCPSYSFLTNVRLFHIETHLFLVKAFFKCEYLSGDLYRRNTMGNTFFKWKNFNTRKFQTLDSSSTTLYHTRPNYHQDKPLNIIALRSYSRDIE